MVQTQGMGEVLESGDAFTIPDLYQKSSLADLEIREPALEAIRSSFSTSDSIRSTISGLIF